MHGCRKEERNHDNRNNQSILFNPCLADVLISFRIVFGIVGVLVRSHGLFILFLAGKALTDSDIGHIEVGVSLKDIFPMLSGFIILAVSLEL